MYRGGGDHTKKQRYSQHNHQHPSPATESHLCSCCRKTLVNFSHTRYTNIHTQLQYNSPVINRRQLLLCSTIVAGGAAITAGLFVYSWWDTPPEEPYQALNIKEAKLVSLLSSAVFPGGDTLSFDGAQAQLDRFFDLFLTHMNAENRTLLKLLLQATDRISLPSQGTLFSNLSHAEQQLCIENMLNHDHHLIRSAYQSLIAILGMGYTTHPTITSIISPLHRCGYG